MAGMPWRCSPRPMIRIANAADWLAGARPITAELDFSESQTYRAYYGENSGNQTNDTRIRIADFTLRKLQRNGKLVGLKSRFPLTEADTGLQHLFKITGYENSDHMVITQKNVSTGRVATFF